MIKLVDISSELSVLIFAISLMIGLTGYLITNVSPGGFVVPGSLVVSALEGPGSLITIAAVAVATAVALYGLNRVTILYGKRLFALTLCISTVLGAVAFLALHLTYPGLFPGDALGFLTPGLLVYQARRQGLGMTLRTTGSVTAATATFALILLAV